MTLSRGPSLGRLGDVVPRHLGIDIRAIAAFRVALAVMLLVDLGNRWALLAPHYTDHGLLPRSAVAAAQNPWHFSFHLLSGEPWAMHLLLALNAVAAVALLMGFRARLMAGVCWIFLLSIHVRAPELLQSGDVLLRLYLLWAIFLPLAGRWSIDRALDTSGTSPPRHVQSMGTAGILLQILAVYFFTGLLKHDVAWLPLGLAVRHALMLEQFTTPLAVVFLQWDPLLKLATWGTMVLELAGPVLLLLPWVKGRARAALVAVFIVLHLSFLPLMTLGQFPFISLVGWILFLPTGVWDRFGARLAAPKASDITIFFDRDCGFCRKMVFLLREFLLLRPALILPIQEDAAARERFEARNSWVVRTPEGRDLDRFEALRFLVGASRPFGWLAPFLGLAPLQKLGEWAYIRVAHNRSGGGRLLAPFGFRRMRWQTGEAGNAAAFLLIVFVLLWNAWTLRPGEEPPDALRWAGHLLRIEQRWAMFSPRPLDISGRVLGVGEDTDGSTWILAPDASNPLDRESLRTLEVERRRFLVWEDDQIARIRFTRLTAPGQRWRKVQEHSTRSERLADLYASFLCRDHARKHPDRPPLRSVTMQLDYRQVDRTESTWSEPMSRKLGEAVCHPE